MVIECKHVWEHISGYLDGTLDAKVLAHGILRMSNLRAGDGPVSLELGDPSQVRLQIEYVLH